jgi:SAM-dependent methyltransferase
MFHHKSCPVCNSPGIFPLLTCTDFLVSSEDFDIYRCGECGFIFTRDYPGEDEAEHYYESPGYISHTDSSRTFFEKTYQFVRRIMLRRKRILVNISCRKKEGNLLDIGSGTGHFLSTMKKSGWSVSGIEINKNARQYSSSMFGVNVFPPEDLKSLPGEEYDCVTLWHVAEHLHDLNGIFTEISRLIKPGASVIVALPNNDSFDSQHYGKFWAAWDVPRHLWHFNPATFSMFAEKMGFVVSSVSVLPFDVFYISILSEKNKRGKSVSLLPIIMGIYFTLLTIFNKMKGSSVVYILKPKLDQ